MTFDIEADSKVSYIAGEGNKIETLISIWKPQKVYKNGIYLVYTRHMTTYSIYLELDIPDILVYLSYDNVSQMTGIYQVYDIFHILVIYLVYTWYISCHSFEVYTGYIPGTYLSIEIMRSALQQNCD